MDKSELMTVIKISLRQLKLKVSCLELDLYYKYCRTLEERRCLTEDELLYLVTNTNLLEKMSVTVRNNIN